MSTKPSPLSKYRYRRRPPHIQKADVDIFVTFCTASRRALPEAARTLVLGHCLREGGILPHAGEGARATLIINKLLGIPASRARFGVWEEESFDHVLACCGLMRD
jgi:hypothetical protein